MQKVRLIVLLGLLLAPVWALAQTTRVKGKVTDAATGKDLPYTTVYFEGTMTGTTTDATGSYFLQAEGKDARYTLTATVVGYTPQTVQVAGGTDIEVNFALTPDPRMVFGFDHDVFLRSILYNLGANRARHDPESRDAWQAGIYSKVVIFFMNFGVNLFLGGINEYFSFTGLNMIFIK